MLTLLKALKVAFLAHRGQRDKGGKAYIFHPLRVALTVHHKEARAVALLHDVVEDSDYQLDDLGFLSARQLKAIGLLTKREGSDYPDYIGKIKQDDIARDVKIADLKHNMCLKRLKQVSSSDLERVEKYSKALQFLEA